MALSHFSTMELQGIRMVYPSHSESNSELMSEDEARNFKEKTGIFQRVVYPHSNNPIQDYMEQGCREVIQDLGWEKETIAVLVCITQTSDMAYPSIANRLHGNLELPASCLCFDVNLGCSGYVYGLHLVYSLLASLQASSANALLCVGDLSSKFIPPANTGIRALFSDGISVSGITKTSAKSESWFNLESFGKGAFAIYSKPHEGGAQMEMDGLEVFKYSAQFVPKNIAQLLSFSHSEMEKLDALVCHQANRLINESIRKALKCPEEKCLYSLDLFGNTSSASIPATLVAKLPKQRNDLNLLLSGFGVGFSIASGIITLSSSCKLGVSVRNEN